MSRADSFAKSSYVARATAAGFGFRDDDFSVQARRDDQPLFWLRLDRDSVDIARITDLSSATVPLGDVALALAAALEIADHPAPFDLWVAASTIATDPETDPRAALAAYARLHRKFILRWQAQMIGAKKGWRVTIGA